MQPDIPKPVVRKIYTNVWKDNVVSIFVVEDT
jgi:hypothetical protein